MTHILIVEDKEENLYYLRTVLEAQGWQVETANTGAEALVKARRDPPDLIVSDLLMPVMDGYTLLRYWKADERLKRIPFIVYTATYTEAEDERLALDLGADAFILKPVEPEDFLARIREVQAREENGTSAPVNTPTGDEKVLLEVYSETLIRKLEERTLQLEEANRELQKDNTVRREMESALRESEARLATATAAGRIGIWNWNLGTGELVWSHMHEALWGLQPGTFGGRYDDFRRGVHPEDREAVDAVLKTAIANHAEYAHEHRVVWPDGSIHWIAGTGAARYDAEGRPLQMSGVVVDITEPKRMEQEVLRAQRVESIGTLAGGIAHDLNNVLGPIILSLDLLKMRCTDPMSQELITMIASSAQRGAGMVRQVLSFACGLGGQRVELRLDRLIRDVQKIATETFLKNIEVQIITPDDVWTVLGDPTQLHQVLLNLCVNARDAMPGGGKLTNSLENLMVDTHYAGLIRDAKPGPYVVLKVRDTGTGIEPAIVEKIFDPFFTTKEVGKGTGLGLATTMGIVRSHGGFIQVESDLGKGTTFSVCLPAQVLQREEARATPEAALPQGHGELILVVDDETVVREITKETLTANGYKVVLAADGTEAVAAFASRGPEFAAVITDLMMPVMDGRSTISVLRRMQSEVPIIATSGLTTKERSVDLEELGVKHFLPKPYSAALLLRTLEEILQKQS
jgi:PAS domain S-box-containing protein